MIKKILAFFDTFPSRKLSLKKIVIVLLISVLIIMPEELFDHALTLAHLAFEGFEYLIEELIQHAFHVSKEESQLYVFYILIAMALGLVFLAYRKAPALLCRFKEASYNAYTHYRQQIRQQWEQLPGLQKILLLTVYLPLFLYVGSFFVM